MSDFLQHFGQEILLSLNGPKPCKTVILPSRRAIGMVKRYMGMELKSPIFLPVFQTMGDFIAELSGLEVVDLGSLSLSLYQTYTKEISQPRPLEDYLSWAPTLLNDFNDIDLSLAPVPEIFQYLTQARAVELWNLNRDPLTEFQQNYLQFWDKMPDIYHAFRGYCYENGIAYQGMAARELSEKKIQQISENEIVYFAGLNLLSKAEEKVIEHFLKNDQGKIFWQADDYYLNDPMHEAGRFIRTYHERWKETGQSELIISKQLLEDEKEILSIACTGNTGQVRLTADLIDSISLKKDESLGIILGDEKLLLPLLIELPTKVEINVTKNLSIVQTPYWQWLKQIIKQISSSEKQDSNQVSGASIERFFNQHFTRLFITWTNHLIWRKEFIRESKAWWSKEELMDSLKAKKFPVECEEIIFPLLFPEKKWDKSFQNVLDALININKQLEKSGKDEDNFLYLQSNAGIAAFRQAGNEVFQNNLQGEMNWSIFIPLLEGLAGKVGLSSVGQQESNIQVMGLLESRGLDFDHLIVVGANDGNLPNHAPPNTFIPLDIRREFKLPGKNEREALFAYHFYRLLQKPGTIYLLYSNQTDELGSGEKSRYIQQLAFEGNKKNPNLKFKSHIVHQSLPKDMLQEEWHISNNEKIIESLKAFFEKGLSPTSLSTLKNCSLQFYFRHLARVREPEQMEEVLQTNSIGSAIHKALEEYYEPFLNKERFKFPEEKNIPKLINQSFNSLFGSPDLMHGYNHLLYQMSVRLMELRIKNDKQWFEREKKLIITNLESKLERIIYVNGNKVLVKGTADRIQNNGNELQILDYKSGRVDEKDLILPELINLEEINDKALQLLCYSWLAETLLPEGSKMKIKAGILPLRKSSMDVFWIVEKGSLNDWLSSFESMLAKLLGELLKPDFIYRKTENIENCEYCSFKGVCNRS